MKTLVVYSQEQLGADPIIEQLSDELGRLSGGQSYSYCSDRSDDFNKMSEEWDMLVLLDATDWYLDHRLLLTGRPWTVLCAFHLDALLPIIRGQASVVDLAVKGIFTNSPGFVTQMSAALPVSFCWKPVVSGSPEILAGSTTFCAVLPNILDRDFSQLVMTAQFLLDNDLSVSYLTIFLDEQEELALPEAKLLEPHVNRQPAASLFSYYAAGDYFVPAPRLTDYRAGIIPSGIIQAAVFGVQPLVMSHPLLKPLEGLIQPMFNSVTSYKSVLSQAVDGVQIGTHTLPEDMRPSPRRFAKQLWAAYLREQPDAP